MASVLEMTSSGAGQEWNGSRVHLVHYYPRKTVTMPSSFSWGQLSVHLLWPGQFPFTIREFRFLEQQNGGSTSPSCRGAGPGLEANPGKLGRAPARAVIPEKSISGGVPKGALSQLRAVRVKDLNG